MYSVDEFIYDWFDLQHVDAVVNEYETKRIYGDGDDDNEDCKYMMDRRRPSFYLANDDCGFTTAAFSAGVRRMWSASGYRRRQRTQQATCPSVNTSAEKPQLLVVGKKIDLSKLGGAGSRIMSDLNCVGWDVHAANGSDERDSGCSINNNNVDDRLNSAIERQSSCSHVIGNVCDRCSRRPTRRGWNTSEKDQLYKDDCYNVIETDEETSGAAKQHATYVHQCVYTNV